MTTVSMQYFAWLDTVVKPR
ncbi:MAG: hypothetical protein HYX60_07480 [Legionella longbeachae]|nr:hypothetical protein [Legionella longbeachae]